MLRGTQKDVDRLTKVRRRAYPVLHRIAQRVGGYVECTTDPAEYVGTVEHTLGRFRTELRSMGFRREPIAALKHHRDGRMSAGSWVFRRSPLADEQLHVTVFRNGLDRIDTYAHWEDSWIRHPLDHYWCHGWDTDRGVATMRSLLRKHDITFRIDRP
ncbi:hypothetical protein [Halopiger djelfimassiliensis]|uniref:hypothetical protein n=1 Tax=Halopiger djelfimassiliensis TaxID=1293047 RepID=UPI000677E157|nr:hypothetical protein [Halopiger djelfimassiliensis]